MDTALAYRIHGGRLLNGAARPLLALAVLAVVAVLVLVAAGFRTLVVRSGSMSPAIRTGDVIVTKVVAPTEAAIGDIVTFRDPSRGSDLVTHRVRAVKRDGAGISFETRGDANTGVERWSVAADGKIGKVVLRIPSAGYPAGWLGVPAVRAVLLAGGGLLLAFALVGRIWLR